MFWTRRSNGRSHRRHVEEDYFAARMLFERVARSHRLTLSFDEAAPVEIACTIPAQSGLAHELNLTLQNHDELHLGIGRSTFSWFPLRHAVQEFETALHGLISGRWRVVERYATNGRFPYLSELQREVAGGWETMGTYYHSWLPPRINRMRTPARVDVLQNSPGA